MIKTSACLEGDAHELPLHFNNLSHYFDPSFRIHREPLLTQRFPFQLLEYNIFGSNCVCLIRCIRQYFWNWDPMSTQECECSRFTGHGVMFWNSRFVRQSCENCISIIERDLQNTVKATLSAFCDQGHAIGVSTDRMAGRCCKGIRVKLDTAFSATEFFVEPSSTWPSDALSSSCASRLTKSAPKCTRTDQDWRKWTISCATILSVDWGISKIVA